MIFVLYCLAAYRVTRLLAEDDFPPIMKLRNYLTAKVGYSSEWSTVFSCPFCLGAYVTLAATTFATLTHTLPVTNTTFLLYWWGMMGAQALMSSLDNKLNG